ncbi:MAG: zinc ribbon domain-containing protein [Chloroflexi bacterium]|nr:zinc ribbon domain-containing protein [Chloroflexota bacterium]
MELPFGWPGGDWQTTARLVGLIIGSYLFLIWVASILWAYRDIRSRTRDIATQVIGMSIIIVLPLVGVPAYLIARPRETLRETYDRQLEQEAILSDLHAVPTCPECQRPVDQDWALCAFCSYQLKEPCVECGRLLQNAWRHCPYCSATHPRARSMSKTRSPEEAERPLDADGDGAQGEDVTEPSRRPRATETMPISARPGRGSSGRRPG